MPQNIMTNHASTPQDKEYAAKMFAVFDTDESGSLDINEYVHATSVHELGTPKDKVHLPHFAFHTICNERQCCLCVLLNIKRKKKKSNHVF